MSAFEFTESRMRFSFDKEVWTEVFKFDKPLGKSRFDGTF